jgi:hypothetical protein
VADKAKPSAGKAHGGGRRRGAAPPVCSTGRQPGGWNRIIAAPGQWLASRKVTRTPSTTRGVLSGTCLGARAGGRGGGGGGNGKRCKPARLGASTTAVHGRPCQPRARAHRMQAGLTRSCCWTRRAVGGVQ